MSTCLLERDWWLDGDPGPYPDDNRRRAAQYTQEDVRVAIFN